MSLNGYQQPSVELREDSFKARELARDFEEILVDPDALWVVAEALEAVRIAAVLETGKGMTDVRRAVVRLANSKGVAQRKRLLLELAGACARASAGMPEH